MDKQKGAYPKLTGNTYAGEDGATALLSLEERIAVQIEHAMSAVTESLAKMQYSFQERLNQENGLFRKEIQQLVRNKNNNENNNSLEATQATACATQLAADREQLPLLQLTPPTDRPNVTTAPQVQYAHGGDDHEPTSDDEYHTTRAMDAQRRIIRPQPRPIRHTNIQLDRWGVIFEGDDDKVPVEEFIFRIEHLQQLHDVPWSVIVGDFHKILRGKAHDWYWIHLRANGTQPWHEFKTAMTKQFKTHRSDFEVMKMLIERKQRYNEDVDDFIHNMRKLQSRLSKPMEEKELVDIVKSNMCEEVAKILYPMPIRTLPELSKEYHKVQRIFLKKRNYQMPQSNYVRPNRPAVSEIAAANGDEMAQSEVENTYENENS